MTTKPFRAWVNADPPGPAHTFETDTLEEAYAALAEGLSAFPDAEVLVGDVQKWNGPPLNDWYDLDGDEEGYRG